jgi:glutamyl-tRNA synthetase, bacterial family
MNLYKWLFLLYNNDMVRTRFAPSPTGYMHLGNARTGIFSYLFARHQNGTFVLRIEDTDRERSTKEFEDSIIEDLKWLGIEWDEFYRQSERFDIYKEYAKKLIDSGHAYYCFCKEEDIEKQREEAYAQGKAYRYPGTCRHLSKEDVENRLKSGESYVIRFKVPDGQIVSFEDMIRGNISINVDDFGDFVIVRSDGSPVYNFVVVIDDALMKITHVIRGEDHISNTPKQILIYEALGFKPPEFAHLPVILGEDRTKLSKRHGGVSVRFYKENGYCPEALFNYLCLLGWSSEKVGKEVISKEEAIKYFDIKDINLSPAVFSHDKLYWLNGVYIREILPEERLLEDLLPFLEKAYGKVDIEYLKKIVKATRKEYNTYLEAVKKLRPFFEEREPDEAAKEELSKIDRKVFELLKQEIESLEELTPENLKGVVKNIQKSTGLKPKDIWHALRIALTGSLEGIAIDVIASILPKEEVLKRLSRYT